MTFEEGLEKTKQELIKKRAEAIALAEKNLGVNKNAPEEVKPRNPNELSAGQLKTLNNDIPVPAQRVPVDAVAGAVDPAKEKFMNLVAPLNPSQTEVKPRNPNELSAGQLKTLNNDIPVPAVAQPVDAVTGASDPAKAKALEVFMNLVAPYKPIPAESQPRNPNELSASELKLLNNDIPSTTQKALEPVDAVSGADKPAPVSNRISQAEKMLNWATDNGYLEHLKMNNLQDSDSNRFNYAEMLKNKNPNTTTNVGHSVIGSSPSANTTTSTSANTTTSTSAPATTSTSAPATTINTSEQPVKDTKKADDKILKDVLMSIFGGLESIPAGYLAGAQGRAYDGSKTSLGQYLAKAREDELAQADKDYKKLLKTEDIAREDSLITSQRGYEGTIREWDAKQKEKDRLNALEIAKIRAENEKKTQDLYGLMNVNNPTQSGMKAYQDYLNMNGKQHSQEEYVNFLYFNSPEYKAKMAEQQKKK